MIFLWFVTTVMFGVVASNVIVTPSVFAIFPNRFMESTERFHASSGLSSAFGYPGKINTYFAEITPEMCIRDSMDFINEYDEKFE